MRIALGAFVLLLAPGAFADKLAVLNFTGPGAPAVRAQIAQALCEGKTCVDPKKVSKGGKPDWAKARKQKVTAIITGKIKAKGAKKTLDLEVHTKAGKPKLKKRVKFSGSELSAKALDKALSAVTRVVGGGDEASDSEEEGEEESAKKEDPPKLEPEPEPKPEVEAPKPDVEQKPEGEEGEARARRRKKDSEPPAPPKEDERRAEDAPPTEPEAPTEEEKSTNPILEGEVGIDIFSRSFSYSTVGTMNLRSYSASAIIAPNLRLEFYPLAFVTKGALAGLGLDGSFATAVGLKSHRSGSMATWPTSLVHYDFDVRFRVKPVKTVDAAVIPFVGYGARSFAVGTGTDGSTLDGLPGVSYSTVRVGVAGELPFSSSGFMVFAKFAALIVLSSGPIISQDYFHKGSNFGLEGQAGIGYRVIGPLQLRAAFDFTRYGLTFTSMATDTYVATGAVDMYIGGNFAVRLIF